MKIAIAQINPTVGDLRGNAELATANIQRAESAGADLVVFPELAITGYPPKDLLLKTSFIEESREMLSLLLPECTKIACIIGFVDHSRRSDAPRVYDPSSPFYSSRRFLHNSAALIKNGKIWGVQHKSKLPNYDVFDERRYFEPATEWSLFEVASTRIAVNICEDIWVEDGPMKRQVEMGADLVITISASPFYTGKLGIRSELLRRRAVECQVPILYVNMVGGQDDLVFDGGSCYFDKHGDQLLLCRRFAEDFAIVDGSESKKPLPESDMISEIHDALVLGIKDYARKNSFSRVVLGLSGGIDSSVVAALAVEAVGADNVRGVIMPSRISSESSAADARRLAANLGIGTSHIPIGDIYDAYAKALEREGSEETYSWQSPTSSDISLSLPGTSRKSRSAMSRYTAILRGDLPLSRMSQRQASTNLRRT
jgi:NAD+ synthase (glutamine-hydrolysing)